MHYWFKRANPALRDLALVLLVMWLARIIFVAIMPPEARAHDAYGWEIVGRLLLAGTNPYHETARLNYPPLWMQVIYVLSRVSTFLDWPFMRVLQISLVAVESAVVVVVYGLIRRLAPRENARRILILGIALNPVAILLVCQQGNFDVLVALWLALFVGALVDYERTREPMSWLYACLFLGLGILTKTVPLMLAPLLATGFRRMTPAARVMGAVLLLGPVSLGMSIIYVLAPADVAAKVIGYRALSGWFGFSGLLHWIGSVALVGAYNRAFYIVLAATLIGLTVAFWRRPPSSPRQTVMIVALLMAAIPAFGPGYGPQYIYWFGPLLLLSFALFDGRWRQVLATFGVVSALTYLVEYALIPSHGMFLIQLVREGAFMDPGGMLMRWSHNFSTHVGATIIRLPLFAAYLMLLAFGIREIWREQPSPTDPARSVPTAP